MFNTFDMFNTPLNTLVHDIIGVQYFNKFYLFKYSEKIVWILLFECVLEHKIYNIPNVK